MKTPLATAALVFAGVVTVHAADIAPVTAHWTRLGEHLSALVYYVDEPDGFHVVVTAQQGAREKAAVVRFETVLAAGQWQRRRAVFRKTYRKNLLKNSMEFAPHYSSNFDITRIHVIRSFETVGVWRRPYFSSDWHRQLQGVGRY